MQIAGGKVSIGCITHQAIVTCFTPGADLTSMCPFMWYSTTAAAFNLGSLFPKLGFYWIMVLCRWSRGLATELKTFILVETHLCLFCTLRDDFAIIEGWSGLVVVSAQISWACLESELNDGSYSLCEVGATICWSGAHILHEATRLHAHSMDLIDVHDYNSENNCSIFGADTHWHDLSPLEAYLSRKTSLCCRCRWLVTLPRS